MNPSCCEHITRLTFSPESVALRVMKASDLHHIRTLHCNLLPVSYPAAFFIQLLVNPRRLCLVATHHDAIIGFASAAMGHLQPSSIGGHTRGPTDQEHSKPRSNIPRSYVTLLTLGVLPAYQRRGIGRSLVHGVIQRLEAACTPAAQPHYSPLSGQISSQDNKIAVLVQVQVAQANSAGKCFYAHLGMTDEQGCDDLWLRVGPEPRTSIMTGMICV